MRSHGGPWEGGIGRWWELLRSLWPRSRIPHRPSGGGALASPLGGPTLRQLAPSFPDRQSTEPCGPVEAGERCGLVHQCQVLRLKPEDHSVCVLSRTVCHAHTIRPMDSFRQSTP